MRRPQQFSAAAGATLLLLLVGAVGFASAEDGDGDGDDDCHPFTGDRDSSPCDLKLTSYRCAADIKDPSKLSSCPTQYNKPCSNATYCPITNRKGVVQYSCPQGGYCPQNTSCVWACPEGYFCPVLLADATTWVPSLAGGALVSPTAVYLGGPIACPPKHFCPSGSAQPTPCRWYEFCSSSQTQLAKPKSQYLGFMGLAGLLIVILLIFACYHFFLRKKEANNSEPASMSFLDDATSLASVGHEGSIPPQPEISIRYDCRQLCLTLRQGWWQKLQNVLRPGSVPPPVILADVSCSIRPGKVTAIMGPSGSGKTSLMSVLQGKAWNYGDVSGEMLLSGNPVTPALIRRMRPIIGYVPQEDTMTRDATVYEVVRFQASGRLPPTTTAAEIHHQTLAVVHSVGLSKLRDKVIGDENKRGISGGQRKRVNVAMEVVTAPSALFLDEPTSGLDATTSLDLMDYLKVLAQTHGVTVTAVIHQPRWEIFSRFDDLILLAPGGRVAYGGPVADVERYFGSFGFHRPDPNVNLADFIMDVVAADSRVKSKEGRTVEDLIEAHHRKVNVADASPSQQEFAAIRMLPSFTHQFGLFLSRSLILGYVRQETRILLEVLICGLGATVLSFAMPSVTFFDVQLQFQLGNLLFTLFCHFSALPTFSQTRAVAVRECDSGFRTLAYFLGKDISLLPRIVFMPLIFSIQYAIISPHVLLGDYFVCYLGLAYSTFGMGLFLSIFLPQDTAQLAAVLVAFIDVLLSGFNPTLVTIWKVFEPLDMPAIGWILTGLSPIRWSLDLLSAGEYMRNSEFWRLCMTSKMWASGYNPDRDGFNSPLPLKVLALFGLGVLFRMWALLVLVIRHKG